MPVGSEWWGAPYRHLNFLLKQQEASPMPVGSEWWGAPHNSLNNNLTNLGRLSPMPVGSEWWGAGMGFPPHL